MFLFGSVTEKHRKTRHWERVLMQCTLEFQIEGEDGINKEAVKFQPT